MNRKIAILAAAVAAFAFTSNAAVAGERAGVDPRIAGVAIGVGAASTAAYFGMNNWKWNWGSSKFTQAGAWGLTTIGCAAVSPIVATVVLNRQLTMREAHILVGSCVIPIVGGWLVNEAYNANPQWEPAPAKPMRKKRHAKR